MLLKGCWSCGAHGPCDVENCRCARCVNEAGYLRWKKTRPDLYEVFLDRNEIHSLDECDCPTCEHAKEVRASRLDPHFRAVGIPTELQAPGDGRHSPPRAAWLELERIETALEEEEHPTIRSRLAGAYWVTLFRLVDYEVITKHVLNDWGSRLQSYANGDVWDEWEDRDEWEVSA